MPALPVVGLRPLEQDDAEVVASWARDPRFCAAAGWSAGLDIAAHISFQLRLITESPGDLVRLGAVHRGQLVGYAVLQGTEPSRRELGFVIGDSRRWGGGLGRQAERAGLDHGFQVLELTEIRAEALASNLASVTILQGLGMSEIESVSLGDLLDPSHVRCFTIERPKSA